MYFTDLLIFTPGTKIIVFQDFLWRLHTETTLSKFFGMMIVKPTEFSAAIHEHHGQLNFTPKILTFLHQDVWDMKFECGTSNRMHAWPCPDMITLSYHWHSILMEIS